MPSAIINTGRNRIALLQANGLPLNATQFVFADIPGLDHTLPVNLEQGMPSNAHIVATLPKTSHGYVAENKVVYSIILSPTVGDFHFNWVGLIDDEGVLIGVSTLPRQHKYQTSGLTVGNTLTRNFLTQYNNAQSITGITVPAETWQISFMDVLDNIDAALIADMRDFFGRSVFFNNAFAVLSGAGGNYFLQPGVGYVEGMRISQGNAVAIGASTNVDVWIEVFQTGTFSGGVSTVEFSVTQPGTVKADFVDTTGRGHYFIKVATINTAGIISDLRTKRTVTGPLIDTFATAQQGAKADTAIQPDQLQNHPVIKKLRRLALAGL